MQYAKSGVINSELLISESYIYYHCSYFCVSKPLNAAFSTYLLVS